LKFFTVAPKASLKPLYVGFALVGLLACLGLALAWWPR
jgi:hypothetical protein